MRIITGKAKGLKLKTPTGWETRPTSDRVKESLFSILNGMTDFFEVETVLDIFSGTGALGLESLSRGAKSAIFIDLATADLILENVRRAKFEDVSKIFSIKILCLCCCRAKEYPRKVRQPCSVLRNIERDCFVANRWAKNFL